MSLNVQLSIARCLSGFAIVASLLVSSHALADSPAPANPIDPALATELKGKWKNELESIMTINSIDANKGLIDGVYQIKKEDGTLSDEFPLIGWVNTAPAAPNANNAVVISFAVRWGKIGSATTWNGYYKKPQGATPVIVGQWLLSRPNSSYEWDHILAGQDQFHPTP